MDDVGLWVLRHSDNVRTIHHLLVLYNYHAVRMILKS